MLEKEKTSLELQLSSREAQEQAYLVQIDHFKSELEEQSEILEKMKVSYLFSRYMYLNKQFPCDFKLLETCHIAPWGMKVVLFY